MSRFNLKAVVRIPVTAEQQQQQPLYSTLFQDNLGEPVLSQRVDLLDLLE